MVKKDQLTKEGFQKIINLKASINLGLKPELKELFVNTVLSQKIVINNYVQEANWVTGFTAGKGCFFVSVYKTHKVFTGIRIYLGFQITQHSRDTLWLKNLESFFKCGKIYIRGNITDFRVTKFSDIFEIIIPFFVPSFLAGMLRSSRRRSSPKHNLFGIKLYDFKDWYEIAEMIKVKKHLTYDGIKRILKIQSNMNRNRKYIK